MLVLAGLMLAVICVPSEIWTHPANDAVYHGFDSNVMYANADTGQVQIANAVVDITAPPFAEPSMNLATSPMPKLTASVDVVVLSNQGADEPLRLGIWCPWTGTGQFVLFGPAPDNALTVTTISNGTAGRTLVGGDVIGTTLLGHYQVGSTYRVSFVVDRTDGRIGSSVTQPDGTKAEALLTSSRPAGLFTNSQWSLTASASPRAGRSHIILRNYTMALPHQRLWAVKVADPRERLVVAALAVLGVLALAFSFTPVIGRLLSRLMHVRFRIGRPSRTTMVVGGAIALYLVGNAVLFPLGGHPFDSRNEELYAYVLRTHGLGDLYYLPNVISLARIWGGVPYIESSFPYGPFFGYLFAGIGWLTSQLFAGGGAFDLNDVRLLYVIKAVNVLFGLADSGLIYLILSNIGVDRRRAVIGSALLLFNPAMWFSMSVWGQNHVISVFFVLAAVWFAEKRLALWAWLSLAAALMTRPQMVVFGLVLGIVLVRRFPLKETLRTVSLTIVICYLTLLPFTLATSPSLPLDVTLNNFRVQEAGGNQAQLTTVSQDAYSIWPLVTYVLHGATGVERAFTSSAAHVVGPVTYEELGLVLTIIALVVVSAALVRRPQSTLESGGYLPLVALGICSFLMLITGVVATYFLLALPFLILCVRWMRGAAYPYVVVIWTVTTLVPMFGDMGAAISVTDYPLLAPAHNAITKYVVALYSWDRFITVSVVANMCALIWLGWLTFRHPAEPIRPTLAQAPNSLG